MEIRCLPTDAMDKENLVLTHSGIIFRHRKNEILSFAAMWMELGNTMSSEICRHRKTSTI
jgi:hypothetical protein